MDLPSNVATGLVVGRYIADVIDGPDANLDPDASAVQGQIVFTASVPYLPNPTAAPAPVTIMRVPIVGVLDSEGYLCTPYPGTLEPQYRGVRLIATDDPDISVEGWTWDVTYLFDPVKGHKVAIPPHGFALPTGGTVDLTKVAKVPSSPGYSLPQAEAAARRAEEAALTSAQDAAAALAAALRAEQAATATDAGIADLLGDQQTQSGDLLAGMLEQKADSSFVTLALSGKADMQAVESLVASKADAAETTEALGRKSDQTAVDNALAKKADKATVTNDLLAKADLVGGKVPVVQLPAQALVSDANVADQVNAPQTGAAIDQRINTQVTPVVQQITADYIASDSAVVDAAAAAVDANPKIAGLEAIASASSARMSVPSTVVETRTALGVRVPFRLPFNSSKLRVHFRNRNPETGQGFAGSISFTAVAVATAQVFNNAPMPASTGAGSTFHGAMTMPDSTEHVTPWKTDYPLTAGTWYHLSYGITTAGTGFYSGAGQAWTNTLPTSVLNLSMSGAALGYQVPLDIWIEAVPSNGGTPEIVFAGILAPQPEADNPAKTSIIAYGDSLTDGGANGTLWPESDTWPYKLGELLPGVTVTNHGYSGATVDEMLIRAGVTPLRLTIPAGGIAVNANAVCEPKQVYGMPSSRRDISTLKYDGKSVQIIHENNQWKVYNWSGAVIPAGSAVFKPATPAVPTATAIIWVGINDNTDSIMGMESSVADHVVAGIQKLVDWLTPKVRQVMLLGVTTRTVETAGSVNHGNATEINDRLKAMYPGWFKSIQEYLRTDALADLGITPTQDDLDKIAAGTLPPSVLAIGDITHISKATAAILPGKFFEPFLRGRGYID